MAKAGADYCGARLPAVRGLPVREKRTACVLETHLYQIGTFRTQACRESLGQLLAVGDP